MKRISKDCFVNSNKALSRADLLENLLTCFSDREDFYEQVESEPMPIIYYDKLTIWTNNCIHHADWTGPDEYESFEESYEFDFEEARRRDAVAELSEFVFDKFIKEEEIASIINVIDNDFLIEYVDRHLLSVSYLFEEEVIDAFYEGAEEQAQYEFDDYNSDY